MKITITLSEVEIRWLMKHSDGWEDPRDSRPSSMLKKVQKEVLRWKGPAALQIIRQFRLAMIWSEEEVPSWTVKQWLDRIERAIGAND